MRTLEELEKPREVDTRPAWDPFFSQGELPPRTRSLAVSALWLSNLCECAQ